MAEGRVADTWEKGNAYEQYVGRWSRQVAPAFLARLRIPIRRKWLDVGCGTGALCAAIIDNCEPSSVIGIEPSQGFLRTATENLTGLVDLRQGSATDIPLDDKAVDVVVSGLVLNFVADVPGALAEMARVTVTGGTVAAYVWDYGGKMELMRYFWDAALDLDPQAAPMHEGLRFPICNPQALEVQFASAGLVGPEVTAIDIRARFASFDDYWQPFLGGQGPAPAYALSLDEDARLRLKRHIRSRMPMSEDGALNLIARSWAVQATVAA